MNIYGKTKDLLNACIHLQVISVRHKLYSKGMNGKTMLRLTCYILSKDDKRIMCQWFLDLKISYGTMPFFFMSKHNTK